MNAIFLIAAVICFIFAGFASNAADWVLPLGLAFFAASFLVGPVVKLAKRVGD